jgi:pilus assembly protein Flp/PilA
MKKAFELIRGLREDEEGAALIEYTVLLGIMLVAVIATIVLVGQWIKTQWTTLQTTLP